MRIFYFYNYHPSLHQIQMPDHLPELSRRDDFNRRPNTGPGEEITQIMLVLVLRTLSGAKYLTSTQTICLTLTGV